MNNPIPKHRNIQIHSEAFIEREIWHKLVVKIILWKAEIRSDVLAYKDKITLSEWKFYSKKMKKINELGGKNKILATLKETKEKIEKNYGFAEN